MSFITAKQVMDQACERTGLSDYGDLWFVEHLEVLIDTWEHEAELSDIGRERIEARVVEILANRLRLRKYQQEHPEILQQSVEKPVIIIGLPRAGTTKLQRMMSASGDFHYLPFWQSWQPVPMESGNDEGGVDPRITAAEEYCEHFAKHSPELLTMHEIGPYEAEEEAMIMQHSFLTKQLFMDANVPSFVDWIDAQDLTPVYRELREWMQFLQWQNGGQKKPWLLKAVYHNEFLDTLLKVFPDAVLIHPHRDPKSVIGSWSSLSRMFRPIYSDRCVSKLLGPAWLAYWSSINSRYLDILESLPEDTVSDVSFKEICDDIEKVIADIYKLAGMELSEEAVANMRQWESNNQQHKHGKHSYTLEEFGLSGDVVDRAFARYRKLYIED
ncbi:MAG: sulfotransferase family protein [bacterium]